MSKLSKWWEIYPAGTQVGDEEKRFFVALARNQKYIYRSVGALSQESGLTKTRCEEIINKYATKGIIVQSNKHPDQWAYWENTSINNGSATALSVSDSDKDTRIKKATTKKP